jgi:glycyl-tRNA synthetase
MSQSTETMERIVALCRRRGFIFGSSEIYGGINGFWDYGPLGVELKRNIKDAWWHDMVRNPPPGPDGREFQMVGVDCSIIMNPKVWEASGHVGGFSDPMVACTAEGCKKLLRADKVWAVGYIYVGDDRQREQAIKEAQETARTDMAAARRMLASTVSGDPDLYLCIEADSREDALAATRFDALSKSQQKRVRDPYQHNAFSLAEIPSGWSPPVCPACGSAGSLTEPRGFNLMFETHTGALQDSSTKVYLRPETAQGIFVNFQNVLDTSRVRIPFGIAQVGKAFRNEITPRNYTFRSREFEQMEIEFFCKPDELCREGEVKALEWYAFWRDVRINWYNSLGIASAKLRPREQGGDELAHYSKACTDIEYLFPFSDEFQELEGVAHRGCFDLSQHGKHAKGKEDAFAVFDDETKQRYVPHVIEPSAGVDRFTLAAITEAYTHDESRASPEFLTFHPRLAPIKAAVFPLVAKDGLPEIAEPIFREIKKHYPCQYDAKQSIGKRYARMDEAGTPFCFTIDGQTKEDGTLTARNRDDASQVRIDKSRCLEYLREKLRL